MQAEVLSVGTELLLGQTVNTDTTIVAKALSGLGIDLLYAAVVGDNVGRLEKAVWDALDRSDILITTGGLGPTGDDLTKETVAAAAGKKLVLHQPSYDRLKEYFARGGLSENQIKQAMLPEGCTVLQNDNGTAPGCAFQTAQGKIVIMLPGPPSELEPMLKNYAVPYLAKFQNAVIASHSVHVYGRGEAAVALMIDDLTQNSNPTAAPYAMEGEKQVYGVDFRTLIAERRINEAKLYMLDHPEATIEQVAAHSGFKDTATFFHRFKSITGDSPRVWISKQ